MLEDEAPALSAAWPDAPPALETLIAAMLAKNPAQRPSADEVDRELAAVRLR